MITIETTPGEHIKQTAIRLRSAAPARAVFNGIEIRATVGETEGEIVAAWEADRAARLDPGASARYYRRKLARRPSGAPGRRSAKPVALDAGKRLAELDALDPKCWPGSLAWQGKAAT